MGRAGTCHQHADAGGHPQDHQDPVDHLRKRSYRALGVPYLSGYLVELNTRDVGILRISGAKVRQKDQSLLALPKTLNPKPK